MANVFRLLKSHHEEVLEILSALNTGQGDRSELVEHLVKAESSHEAAEEMHIWPAVREKLTDGGVLTEEALRQEQEGKELLDQMRRVDLDGEGYGPLIASFDGIARRHITFEEQRVWPKLMEVLTPPDVEALGTNVEIATRTGQTLPHPRVPSSPAVLKTVGPAAAVVDRARDRLAGR